jgi:GntR family transcriptional regulator/MocR family aminotransferase
VRNANRWNADALSPEARHIREEIAAAARRANVDILGLTSLYADKPLTSRFFDGFCCLHGEEIEDAVKKLAAIFRLV